MWTACGKQRGYLPNVEHIVLLDRESNVVLLSLGSHTKIKCQIPRIPQHVDGYVCKGHAIKKDGMDT